MRDIQYASVVAEERSFSKAAKRLYVSQPALSQAINRLEGKLGLKLFDREGGQIALTPARRVFVDNGAGLLYMNGQLEERMHAITSMQNETLRIGISQFYGQYHLPNFLPQFCAQYPGVKIDLIEEQSAALEGLVLENQVDFAMVPLPLDNKRLNYQVLHQEQILFAAPKNLPFLPNMSYSKAPELPYIDLSLARDEPFIFLKNMRFTQMGLSMCEEAGFTPNIRFETRSWNTVLAFIEHGLGVGFLNDVLVYQNSQAHNINFYRILNRNACRPYTVVYKDYSQLSPFARNFINIAKNIFDEYQF